MIANVRVRGTVRPNRSGVRKRGAKTRGQQTTTPKNCVPGASGDTKDDLELGDTEGPQTLEDLPLTP